MKLAPFVVLLFLSLAVPSLVYAQTEQPAWPPDPAEIFAPNVTVMSVEYESIAAQDNTEINKWIFIDDPLTGRTAVTNSETGEAVALIPRGTHGGNIEISPDGKYLLLYVHSGIPASQEAWLYSYDLEARKLVELGGYALRSENRIDRWLDSERAIMYNADMPEGWAKELLYFDLAEPDSLRQIITGRARYHDDPPRYEFVETQLEFEHRADSPLHTNCSVEVFDLSLLRYNSADLGENCYGNVLSIGRDYYFMSKDGANFELNGLKLDTGARTMLYRSTDFVGLDSISLDGRYAVLLNDNGTGANLWD